MHIKGTRGLATQSLVKLTLSLPEEPFMKWGVDFMRLIKLVRRYTRNKYIVLAIDYAIKCVEAKTLRNNTIGVIAKKLYECILTRFGCPLIIVTNHGVHFINDVIKYVTNHFLMKHVSSTVYYLQKNGQAKFINKVLRTLLTKLVS
jgi:hypothetical protein